MKNDFSTLLKTYIQDLNLNVDKINIFIDIQNLSIGRYDSRIAEQYMLKENYTPIETVHQLLYWLSIKHNEIYNELGILPKFILYTDKNRNLFNSNFIPSWKADRKKSFEKMMQENPVEYQYRQFANQSIKSTFNILGKFINKSTALRMIILEYIDSDFIPYVEKIRNPNSLNVILSSDHDYYHMLTEDEYTIRYIFLEKIRESRKTALEHMYNSWVGVKKKYSVNEEEAKYIAKYYSVYHSLIGDASDHVPSLIKRKGIKYWLKKTLNNLPDLQTIRDNVLNNECFIDELLDYKADSVLFKDKAFKPKTKWDEFRMRYFIFDFYFTGHFLNRDNNEKSYKIYEKFILNFPYQKQLIDKITESYTKQMNEDKLNIDEANELLMKLGINDSLYISQSLFY